MVRLLIGFVLGLLAMSAFGCATTNGTDMGHERHQTGIESHTND